MMNSSLPRFLRPFLEEALPSRMVFLGGPRQAGKTSLAKSFLGKSGLYLNWDQLADRERLLKHDLDPNHSAIVLDEIHKYVRWRMLLKGFYDTYSKECPVLVTGSARLDILRKGGDSLFGRYRYFRLHPFHLLELDKEKKRSSTELLLELGGFPEPLSSGSSRKYRLWKLERIARVLYQDLRDLDLVKDISKLELLVTALPVRVGSPLSIASLQEDLEVSPHTVNHWIQILETIYYCYTILPFGAPKLRAIKKSRKLYLWDWAEIESKGARWENFIASQLLNYCHFQEDVNGYTMEIRYLRDAIGREIDFIVLRDKKPIFAVECKTGEGNISPHLHYFSDRLAVPIYYQVHLGTKERKQGKIHLLPWEKFCTILERDWKEVE